jgi:EAL domain-containing protein (putative c-di-GMP-specific phosphodiesterase class I)
MNIKDTQIILIDDDDFQRKLTKHQLSELGIQNILSCTNGLEAFDLINNQNLYKSLILLDLNMPIMNGVSFVNLLKGTPFKGALILISGADSRIQEATVKMASNYGLRVLDHLKKPVNKEQLKTAINKFPSPPTIKTNKQPSKKYSVERFQQALATGELFNEYQPKINVKNGEFVGVEALVRWAHPNEGIIPPSQFISLAEESDTIIPLFQEVMKKAIRDWRDWKDLNMDLSLSVNVSMDNLNSTDFIDFIENTIKVAGIPAEKLILEITESKLMKEYALVLNILTNLRLKKVNLSIDDFGTGHSSMVQLRDIPFNELKLDKHFVHNASDDKTLSGIFNGSMQIAKNLDIMTVAEGVENSTDWDFLKKSDCDIAQGFFIAKPMPAHLIKSWSQKWREKYISLTNASHSLLNQLNTTSQNNTFRKNDE